jgi:hypothetical protein
MNCFRWFWYPTSSEGAVDPLSCVICPLWLYSVSFQEFYIFPALDLDIACDPVNVNLVDRPDLF